MFVARLFFLCGALWLGWKSTEGNAIRETSVATNVRPDISKTTIVSKVYESVLEQDGIVIYKKNRTGSDYNEVLGQVILNSDYLEAVSYFLDADRYKDWVYSCIKSEFFKVTNQRDFLAYLQIKLPWPFQNRDLVSSVKFFKSSKNSRIISHLKFVSSEAKKPADFVRVENWESIWLLEPIKPNEFRLSISMWSEPGGNLPAGVANLVLARIELWTMQNLVEKLTSNKNTSAKIDAKALPSAPPEIEDKVKDF